MKDNIFIKENINLISSLPIKIKIVDLIFISYRKYNLHRDLKKDLKSSVRSYILILIKENKYSARGVGGSNVGHPPKRTRKPLGSLLGAWMTNYLTNPLERVYDVLCAS